MLLVESTYGDRLHPDEDDGATLARIIKETVARRGKVIIPAFAIGRVEELLYWLFKLEDEGRLPKLPIYVDSPMAIKGIEYYDARTDELDQEIVVDAPQAAAIHAVELGAGVEGAGRERRSRPSIIASSGMATGGRVVHHLFAGSAGPAQHRAVRRISGGRHARPAADRRRPAVKIFGQHVPVHARIEKIDGMSAHADAGEIVRWLRTFPRAPKTTYLVHGELVAQEALKARITKELGWNVEIPAHGRKSTCRCRRPTAPYLLEQIDDAAVVQLYADGFDKLPLKEKTLVWHLYQAALAGRDIYYDQRHRHNLGMRASARADPAHPDGHRRRHAGGADALHEAVLAQHRPVQQPHRAQVPARPRSPSA